MKKMVININLLYLITNKNIKYKNTNKTKQNKTKQNKTKQKTKSKKPFLMILAGIT